MAAKNEFEITKTDEEWRKSLTPEHVFDDGATPCILMEKFPLRNGNLVMLKT
ncbi:MAG: hypothetical protein ACR9NN_16995 [Nostochopsis sp.]